MYLFYDSGGNLKEVINDLPARMGNQNWNAIYAYWDNEALITGATIKYKLPDGTVTQEYSANNTVSLEIPFDKKRDLKFFEYYKSYSFKKFIVPTNVLSMTGAVLFEITMTTSESVTTMGSNAFEVNGINTRFLPDQYISLAQWNELKLLLANLVTINTNQSINSDKTFLIEHIQKFKGTTIFYFGDEGQVFLFENGQGSQIELYPDEDLEEDIQVKLPTASGTLALLSDLASKANDSAVVHLAGTETVSGHKTFTGGITSQTQIIFKKNGHEVTLFVDEQLDDNYDLELPNHSGVLADQAYVGQEIDDHNNSQIAHSYIRGLISAEVGNRQLADAALSARIDAISGLEFVLVSSLPTASASTMNKIYLVPSTSQTTGNVKDEFITLRSGSEGAYSYAWEQIGSTQVDLSNYYTKAQSDNLLNAKQDKLNYEITATEVYIEEGL